MIQPDQQSTVLIVDDDEVGRLLLEGALEGENFRILTAANGESGLALARAHRPDVVVLDVMMPEVDGYAVCRRLRADEHLSHVPILFLTTLNDGPSRREGLAAGADEFLSKPVDVVEFRTRLRTITRLDRFRRMAEERERFEAIFAHAPDAMVIVGAQGQIFAANPAAAELGLPSEMGGEGGFYPCFSAADAGTLRVLAAAAASRPGRAGPVEAALLRANGDPRTVEITAAALPWAGSPAVEYTLRDVTERKRMEAWLMRSQRIELLGQFASEIVHDVNNMLSTVVFSAAQLGADSSAEAREQATRIEATAVRAGAVLRRILQFARGTEGAMEPRELGQAAERCADLIGNSLGRKITVVRAFAREGSTVRLDENQLHQLLLNLCVNARDAMSGEGTIELSVAPRSLGAEEAARLGSGARPGSFGVLSVRDSGPGMPPQVKARLFEPFFTTKAPGKGTGLGLAAVARIMQAHGGFVTLESEPGAGACFDCHFPLAT